MFIEDDEWLAQLVPVSQWIFNEYKVEYLCSEDDPIPRLMKTFVDTECHIEGTIESDWPSPTYSHYKYTLITANVPRPR